MDYIKKFIYIYLFVLLINKYRDYSNSSYIFCDSLNASFAFFKIKGLDTKTLFENKDYIYSFILIFKFILTALGVIGFRIGPLFMMFWVMFDSLFNVKNWNQITLLFNICKSIYLIT